MYEPVGSQLTAADKKQARRGRHARAGAWPWTRAVRKALLWALLLRHLSDQPPVPPPSLHAARLLWGHRLGCGAWRGRSRRPGAGARRPVRRRRAPSSPPGACSHSPSLSFPICSMPRTLPALHAQRMRAPTASLQLFRLCGSRFSLPGCPPMCAPISLAPPESPCRLAYRLPLSKSLSKSRSWFDLLLQNQRLTGQAGAAALSASAPPPLPHAGPPPPHPALQAHLSGSALLRGRWLCHEPALPLLPGRGRGQTGTPPPSSRRRRCS